MLPENGQNRIKLIICIGIVIAVVAAYEPVRHNDFVKYDDPGYITENPGTKAGLSLKAIGQAFVESYVFMWHPLTTISLTIDYEFFELNPVGHHLVGVLIHIINAILLFWLLVKITGATWASAFVAGVFAVHPLQVESVAWAAERKTLLSGLFVLLTISVYGWYSKRPGIGRYMLVFAVYGLCIMTKPTVVIVPLLLFALDYWPLERFQKAGFTIKKAVIEKLPLFGLSGFLSIITVAWQTEGGAVIAHFPASLRANIFFSYIRYICKTIWPSKLSAFYPFHIVSFKDPIIAGSLLLFLLITIYSIYAGRRKKYLLAGWLWFVISLIPVIGIVQSGAQAMANRYMYLSMTGLLFIIAWTVKDVVAKHRNFRYIAIAASAVVLAALIILTRMHVGHWRNSATLWEYALKTTRDNCLAENNYASVLSERGLNDQAEAHLRNAVRINPMYDDALRNLGNIHLWKKNYSEAIDCYNRFLKQRQDSAEVYYKLATALAIQKRYGEALKNMESVLKLDPNFADARKKTGVLLMDTGQAEKAITYFTEALRAEPNQADIYEILGSAYNQTGKEKEAIANWSKAAQIEPNNASILNNLAWVLANSKDESVRDITKAVELAERACGLTDSNEPEFLDTLATAYAAAGRFEEAVKTAGKAIDLAKAAGREELAVKIESQLESYKKRQRQ